MQLWPDEYEALRAEMRDTAGAAMAGIDQEADTGLSVEQRVAQHRAIAKAMAPPPKDGLDRVIAGVPCRLFVPDDPPTAVYLHFHGGGMILGDPSQTDTGNEQLMAAHGMAVVSVDYRLAPEHPYPAGPDDGEVVAAWLIEHAEAEFGSARLLTGGESAGAYMAACTLLRVRDRLGAVDHFAGANLVFGVYDWSGTPSQLGRRPSHGADLLTPELIEFFTSLYLPDRRPDQRRDPDISPAYADLSDMPPAFMTVGTADHLVDDTLTLAARWAAHGNEVDLHVLPDAPHGFTMYPDAQLSRHHEARSHAWFAARVAARD